MCAVTWLVPSRASHAAWVAGDLGERLGSTVRAAGVPGLERSLQASCKVVNLDEPYGLTVADRTIRAEARRSSRGISFPYVQVIWGSDWAAQRVQ